MSLMINIDVPDLDAAIRFHTEAFDFRRLRRTAGWKLKKEKDMSSSVDVEREALAVVDRYLVALNARDTEAIRDAFNFPHARIGAKGTLVRYEKATDYRFENFFGTVSSDGWDHTKWDRTQVVFATQGKAHVAVDFTRYRKDGSVIGKYFSLYVVTCNEDHWGIQVGSGNGG